MREELEDYFIPTKRNNYAPHGLQKAALIGMVMLVVLSFTIANLYSLIWIGSQFLVSTILPAVIVELTNEERGESSLGNLQRNATLDEAARMKAEHMAKNQYFSHYSPDGVSPWYWFKEADYNYVHAGENLAIHFTDSSEVVEAWMDSPTHRANIMNGNYTQIGVGTAEGTYEGFATVYVVQLFGTPAQAQAPVEDVADSVLAPLAQTEAPAEQEDEEVLAEAVSLTEEVEIIEAEPVLVATTQEVKNDEETASEVVAGTETASTTASTTLKEEDLRIVSMEDTPYGVALYSGLISTSTGGIPASIEPDVPQKGERVPFFLSIATQPHALLQLLYTFIGAFVLILIILSIVIEVKRQHPIQIAYGMAMLVAMVALYSLHVAVSGGALIV